MARIGVLDPNSASDSDLWIAYDLLQAGRLWNEASYTQLGEALAAQIAQPGNDHPAGLGPMLLPGPQGFKSGGVTRLNPSYLPLPVLRALAHDMPDGPWGKLADNAYKLIKTTAPHGFAPDWAAWQDGQFVVDPKDRRHRQLRRDPRLSVGRPRLARRSACQALARGARRHAREGCANRHSAREGRHRPPARRAAKDRSATGARSRRTSSRSATSAASVSRAPIWRARHHASPGREPVYYDRVLGLFGTGFIDGRYRFDEAGRLVPSWRNACD